MKSTEGNYQPNRRLGPDGKPQDAPVVSYTPEQLETIHKGLRILARVAIRSYMEEETARSQPEDEGEEECR